MSINRPIAAGAILIALLVAVFFLMRSPGGEQGGGDVTARAEAYCGKSDVAAVFTAGDTIKVVGSLLGAGATYYRADGSELRCPVVGPDAMSAECKDIQAVEYWTEICNTANRR